MRGCGGTHSRAEQVDNGAHAVVEAGGFEAVPVNTVEYIPITSLKVYARMCDVLGVTGHVRRIWAA